MIATDGKPTISNATGPGAGGVKRIPSWKRKDVAANPSPEKCGRCGLPTNDPREMPSDVRGPYCPDCSKRDMEERIDFEIEIRSQS